MAENETPNASDNPETETPETVVEQDKKEGIEAHSPEATDLEKLREDLNQTKDKYLRLFADFENFRRRTAKEKLEFITTANENLIVSLLPVLDDFERAEKNFKNPASDIDPLKQGIDLIVTKFRKTLESKGLKAMESMGQVFNVELHEGITQFAAPSDDLKGKVIDEVERGYYLGDKVIRFAKVVIGI